MNPSNYSSDISLRSLLNKLIKDIKPRKKMNPTLLCNFEAGKQQAIQDIISLIKAKDC